jgi:NADH-quinone oxidoreductase subunit N
MMNEFIPFISSSINNTIASLSYFQSEVTLVAGFLLVILSDLFLSKKYPQLSFGLTICIVLIVMVQSFGLLHIESKSLFGGMVILDHLSVLFKILFCLVSLLFVLFVRYNRSLQEHEKGIGDLYAILLAVHLGMNLMAMSANLLMVYMALEMVSLGSYLMVGYISHDPKQSEASLKYALFGAACSAIMLYGISLLYGFTGSLYLNDPSFIFGLNNVPPMALGVSLIMVLIGIAFKLSVVPLHFWAPDVYEGAPTPVTAFLSTGPKIAGFALLIKFIHLINSLSNSLFDISLILTSMAIASMVLGNFAAIWQNNTKRMLAYSSIGHTGFMIMALFVATGQGYKALIFYMFVYVIMNMAAFLIVDEIEEQTGKQNLDEYKGLGQQLSILMVCFVLVLVSLTGLPPTVGFTAKFFVFSTALDAYNSSGSLMILIMITIAAISTLVSLFYYFKVPLNAYLRESEYSGLRVGSTAKTYLSVFLAFLLLLLIVFPSLIEQFL